MAAESGPADRVRYRFSPLERRGVIAGWRGGQIASVAVGLLLAVLALRSHPTVGGAALALVAVAAGVAVAFWPIGGRTGEQWLPLCVRWINTTGGRRCQHAPHPGIGHRAIVDMVGSPPAAPRIARSSPARRVSRHGTVFDGVSIRALPIGADDPRATFGGIVDRPARTLTGVLALRGHSFALLAPRDQDARISAWARVLSAMAREGSEVHRLQWIESCLPDQGGAVRNHWSDHAVLGPDTAAGRSYRSLIDESSPSTRRHQVLMALSIHTAHSARSIRTSGGGMTGAATVLAREVRALHRALEGADVTVDGVLGPARLARLVNEHWAPIGEVGERSAREELADGAVAPWWPWPMAIEPDWDAVHADGTWHATYWIAEWPRIDVTPDFLGPLLFSPLRRSIALTMEPVSPNRAARQVAQARTADLADRELRRRGGFLVTARHTREKEGVEDRDVELAEGHAQYRFSGYVTVTAETRQDLSGARLALEQAASQARIELRLLYGEQDIAFASCLPLGRGLS